MMDEKIKYFFIFIILICIFFSGYFTRGRRANNEIGNAQEQVNFMSREVESITNELVFANQTIATLEKSDRISKQRIYSLEKTNIRIERIAVEQREILNRIEKYDIQLGGQSKELGIQLGEAVDSVEQIIEEIKKR